MDNNKNKNETGVGDVAKGMAKQAKKTVKGAKAAAKVAAKAASGNYVGAVVDFFKNPREIFEGVIIPVFVVMFIIVGIIGSLVSPIWNTLSSSLEIPQISMVDEYMDELAKIETKCFSKAYASVSEQALTEISNKVTALDLGEFNDRSKSVVFKDKDSVQKYLGYGYNQMRNFQSRTNTFGMYENVKLGQNTILSVLESSCCGFDNINYETTNDGYYTNWTRTVHIIDFNNYDNNNNVTSLSLNKLDKTDKIIYNINYNNQKANTHGVSMSMFETIFNTKYDYEHHEELFKEGGAVDKINEQMELFDKANPKNSKYSEIISGILDTYKKIGDDTYYLDGDIITKINSKVDKYNKSVKKEFRISRIDENENTQKKIENITKNKKKEFIEFMSDENVYSKLLTYSISVDCIDNADSENSYFSLPQYNVGTEKNPDNSGDTVKNIKKIVNVDIDVDFCDYDTLAKIFGFVDEDGVENVGYINWILSNNLTGYSESDIANTNSEKENKKESNTKETQSSDKKENPESFSWPLDEGVYSVSSLFEDRVNPVTGKKESHKGVDFAAPAGTNIYASKSGVVTKATNNGNGYGNYIVIKHDDGTETLYGHCRQLLVYQGNTVKQGQIIALVGSTGQSTGNHLHFEVHNEDGKAVNPLTQLEGAEYISGVMEYGFCNSLPAYFDSCKDAGEATAAILSDAGYVKSSIFWQYKVNTFNVMFSAAVVDDSKLPFFVDTNNIARNEDGTLKIVEFNSAEYSAYGGGIGSTLTNMSNTLSVSTGSGTIQSTDKKYYAVYCQPNTIINLPISAALTDFNYENASDSNDLVRGWANFKKNLANKYASGDENRGYSFYVSKLSNTKTDENGTKVVSGNENEDSNFDKNALNLNYTKDSSKPYDLTSYAFKNISFGFEVDNIQISTPDENQNKHIYTGNDYANNIYGTFIRNGLMPENTIDEYLDSGSSESDYQINSPVILGNTLDSNLNSTIGMNDYDVNNTDSYPYFVVSVSIIAPAVMEVANTDIGIYDVFDLDITDDLVYTSSATGYSWPVVKSYEHTVEVTSTYITGKIKSKDENSITIESNASYFKISNIIPNENLKIGEGVSENTILGYAPDGAAQLSSNEYLDMIHVSQGIIGKEGFEEKQVLNSALNLKLTMNVSLRSELCLNQDGNGKYAKIISMFNGYVTEKTNNSITVFSVEEDLYYKYSNITPNESIIASNDLSLASVVSSGQIIGISHLVNDEATGQLRKVNVNVYKTDNKYTYYYNPMDYFPELPDMAENTRMIKIYYNNIDAKGITVNKGKTRQLSANISPKSAWGDDIIWTSSDNNIVSVTQDGLITASSSNYGTAIVTCSFANGEGIAGSCVITVPEKMQAIEVTYKSNDSNTSNYANNNDFIKVYIDSNKKAKINFDAKNIDNVSFSAIKWSITDKFGNGANVSINENGIINATDKNAMTADDYYIVKCTALDISAEDAELDNLSAFEMSFRVQIVQPVESITYNGGDILLHLNPVAESYTLNSSMYTVYPANATYKDVSFRYNYLDGVVAVANPNSINSTTITAANKGSGSIQLVSNNGYNGSTVVNTNKGINVRVIYLVDRIQLPFSETCLLSGQSTVITPRYFYTDKNTGQEIEIDASQYGIDVSFDTANHSIATASGSTINAGTIFKTSTTKLTVKVEGANPVQCKIIVIPEMDITWSILSYGAGADTPKFAPVENVFIGANKNDACETSIFIETQDSECMDDSFEISYDSNCMTIEDFTNNPVKSFVITDFKSDSVVTLTRIHNKKYKFTYQFQVKETKNKEFDPVKDYIY